MPYPFSRQMCKLNEKIDATKALTIIGTMFDTYVSDSEVAKRNEDVASDAADISKKLGELFNLINSK